MIQRLCTVRAHDPPAALLQGNHVQGRRLVARGKGPGRCVSVDSAEIANIFGPKDSMQDTTLLARATMLLSNERNYCHTSGQRVKALELLRQSSSELIRRVQGGVHRCRGSVGSRAHRASGAR